METVDVKCASLLLSPAAVHHVFASQVLSTWPRRPERGNHQVRDNLTPHIQLHCNLALKLPTMQFGHRQFGHRFRCVMLMWPWAWSINYRWGAGCRGRVNSLPSDSKHTFPFIFLITVLEVCTPSPPLTQARSLQAVYQTSSAQSGATKGWYSSIHIRSGPRLQLKGSAFVNESLSDTFWRPGGLSYTPAWVITSTVFVFLITETEEEMISRRRSKLSWCKFGEHQYFLRDCEAHGFTNQTGNNKTLTRTSRISK